MRQLGYSFLLVLTIICYQGATQQVAAQPRRTAPAFQGVWTWDYYLKDKDLRDPELGDIYKRLAAGADIRKAPFMSLTVVSRQQGDKLSASRMSVMRFGNRMGGDSFTALIKGNVAQFELKSWFGGSGIVRLINRRNKLYWNILKFDNSEGDIWFPDRAILQRAFFPSIRGVSLGSTLKEVIEALGEPKRRTIVSYDVCGKNLQLQYSGLLIEICDEGEPNVRSLTLTGKQWRMSRGLRVGMTDLEVEKVIGIPDSRQIDQEQGYEVLFYRFAAFDRFINIYLSKYKVVRIEMLYDET